MSMINITLDTKTRKAYLTVDGIVVTTDDFYFSKFLDYDTGEERIEFSYTYKTTNEDGMEEQRRFYLPQKIGAALVSEKLDLFAKAKADTIKYLESRE